jgi:hypothetical protein
MEASAAEPAQAPGGVRPESIVGFALAAFAGLSVLNLVAVFVVHSRIPGRKLARAVYFNAEANLATFFNFLLIIGVTALLALNAARAYSEGDRWRHHWVGLIVLTLLMAFDEAAQVHERLNDVIRMFVEFDGYLRFAWVIPGMTFVAAVAIVYLRFVLALPRRAAALTLLGGGMFVAGSLGVELIGAKLWSEEAADTVRYGLVTTLEESLEMLGLMIFAYALMLPLADSDGRLRLSVRSPRA